MNCVSNGVENGTECNDYHPHNLAKWEIVPINEPSEVRLGGLARISPILLHRTCRNHDRCAIRLHEERDPGKRPLDPLWISMLPLS